MKFFLSKKSKNYTPKYDLLLGLTAVELLMSFSFLGYVHVDPISITFAYIPVLLAGCLINPAASAFVGVAFGLASMWKASASYVAAGDRIFSPALSGAPLESILLSVGSRALFGLTVGLLFYFTKKAPRFRPFWIALISAIGKTLHAVFVYGFMGILFPEQGFHLTSAFESLGSASDLVTILVTILIVVGADAFLHTKFYRRFEQQMQLVHHLDLSDKRYFLSSALVLTLTLVCAFTIALYFLQRMLHVLDVSGYHLDETTHYNLLHLQIQFLLGIFSLAVLVALFFLFIYRHMNYVNHKANSDELTGVLNRNGFFPLCSHLLSNLDYQKNPAGYFMVLDVDYFKHINDSMGHPKGDEVLYQVAQRLQENFSENGTIGRLGGDEFAVLIYSPLSQENLEFLLNRFMRQVRQIPCAQSQVSCSIGVTSISSPAAIAELYKNADSCLYLAKKQGRNQFCIHVQTKS